MTLQHGRVGLRPIRQRDRDAWVEVRAANVDWLATVGGHATAAHC